MIVIVQNKSGEEVFRFDPNNDYDGQSPSDIRVALERALLGVPGGNAPAEISLSLKQ